MDQVLKECPAWIGIADDFTLHGCTEAEHDAYLCNLMPVACKYGVVFNPQKMHVKAPAVNFFGCQYYANGVHPDPEKVDAVHALPAPTNVSELQEFLSMVTYLSPFICGLSTLTAPLCKLLMLCKAVWSGGLFFKVSRGNYTAYDHVYCDTQLLILRFSFLCYT